MADIDVLMPLIKQFMPFAQKQMGFDRPPNLFLKGDSSNAADPLGKTGFYDPQAESITLYITARHPKDVLRSLSHELMHHTQNCRGDFTDAGEMGEGYAQSNPHMRNMEIEAYKASICFRDWEDSLKETIYYEHLQKGDKTMSTKDWKNGELKSLLTEAWGFKMDLNKLNEGTEGAEEYSAAKHRTAGNTIEEKAEEVEEMCGPDAEGHGGEEVVVMGDEEGVVGDEAADPATRVAALMDELKGLLLQLAGGEEVEEVPMDEKRARGRRDARHVVGRGPDARKRPGDMNESGEAKLREMVRKAIKEAMK